MANAKPIKSDKILIEEKTVKIRLDKQLLMLAASSFAFVASLLFLLFSFLGNNVELFAEKVDKNLYAKEYLYYDITLDSAKFYILLEQEINTGSSKFKCSPKDTEKYKEYNGSQGTYVINDLTPNTEYKCKYEFNAPNGVLITQEVGLFRTLDPEYLEISEASFDAYDVGFSVVFRASWSSSANSFLLTKTAVNEAGQIISQEERIVKNKARYTDSRLSTNTNYIYEIAAYDNGRLGDPIIFEFQVAKDQRLENITTKSSRESMRILNNDLPDTLSSSPVVQIEDVNSILRENYKAFSINSDGIPILTKQLENYAGKIVAGNIVDNNFVPKTIYILDDISDNYITNIWLEGKTIFIESPSNIKSLTYYSPYGEQGLLDIKNMRGVLNKVFPYIYVEIPNGNLIALQKSNEFKISYDANSRKISWTELNLYDSYILTVSNDGKQLYRVLTSKPEYILDSLISYESLNVSIVGYGAKNVINLGSEQIENISTEVRPATNLTFDKLGKDLSISWEGDVNIAHNIEVSLRGANSWKTLGVASKGINSYLVKSVISLDSGNYVFRVSPSNSIGEATNASSECYIRVNKDKDYRILCD